MKVILIELSKIRDQLSLNQPVLSFKQFCLFADLSEEYVRKLHNEGRIPFYRPFGRKLYITREDAIACLTQNPVSNCTSIEKVANQHLLNSKTTAL